jgi:glycosyltransferase involved in cell wall biosynthesis
MKLPDTDCEIICIDDASNDKWHAINDAAGAMCQTFIRLDDNVGRARIRNLFLQYARYDYLLFLDGDSLIIRPDFLKNYCQLIRQQSPDVVCGGRVYPSVCPDKAQRLSWKYGTQRESKPAIVRQISPNSSFMTNNFLIRRDILENIRFDERLSDYGHEDTLFGFELKRQGITVLHTENAVLNGDIETNDRYLSKTEDAVLNLIQIADYVADYNQFANDVSLLKYHNLVKSMRLEPLINGLYFLAKPIIKMLLCKGIVSLRLFDFYKLGFLIQSIRVRKI